MAFLSLTDSTATEWVASLSKADIISLINSFILWSVTNCNISSLSPAKLEVIWTSDTYKIILHSTEKRALRKELHSFPTKINVHLPLTYCYPGSKLLDRDAELLSFYYYSGTAAHTSKSYSRIPFRFSYWLKGHKEVPEQSHNTLWRYQNPNQYKPVSPGGEVVHPEISWKMTCPDAEIHLRLNVSNVLYTDGSGHTQTHAMQTCTCRHKQMLPDETSRCVQMLAVCSRTFGMYYIKFSVFTPLGVHIHHSSPWRHAVTNICFLYLGINSLHICSCTWALILLKN